jgi:hypothetical protein
MIKYFLILLCLFMTLKSDAQHKRKIKKSTKAPVSAITMGETFFTDIKGGVRFVGRVYEMNIQTNVPNLIIDSVWFGATPVPCDVYDMSTTYKVDTLKQKGKYLIKANRDLYKYFSERVDSTIAAATFKRPFPFDGDAVLFYKQDGKRNYFIVRHIEQRPMKHYRQ